MISLQTNAFKTHTKFYVYGMSPNKIEYLRIILLVICLEVNTTIYLFIYLNRTVWRISKQIISHDQYLEVSSTRKPEKVLFSLIV